MAAETVMPTTLPPALAEKLQPSLRQMYLDIFAALSEPIRLQILLLIASADAEEYHCTSLEQSLPVGKSTISYHVKILSQAGLVSVRREGRLFRYRARRDVLDFFIPGLLERVSADGFDVGT